MNYKEYLNEVLTTVNSKNRLVEDLEKLRDFNVNVIPNKSLAEYYQKWINQAKEEKILDDKLKIWIEHQIDYWGPKDRTYTKYLESLLK